MNTQLRPKVQVMLRRAKLRHRVTSTSFILAKRNEVSRRATVKGTPTNITGLTGGRNYAIVTFTKTLRRNFTIYRRVKVSTTFYVRGETIDLRRTVSQSTTVRGLASAYGRTFQLIGTIINIPR